MDSDSILAAVAVLSGAAASSAEQRRDAAAWIDGMTRRGPQEALGAVLKTLQRDMSFELLLGIITSIVSRATSTLLEGGDEGALGRATGTLGKILFNVDTRSEMAGSPMGAFDATRERLCEALAQVCSTTTGITERLPVMLQEISRGGGVSERRSLWIQAQILECLGTLLSADSGSKVGMPSREVQFKVAREMLAWIAGTCHRFFCQHGGAAAEEAKLSIVMKSGILFRCVTAWAGILNEAVSAREMVEHPICGTAFEAFSVTTGCNEFYQAASDMLVALLETANDQAEYLILYTDRLKKVASITDETARASVGLTVRAVAFSLPQVSNLSADTMENVLHVLLVASEWKGVVATFPMEGLAFVLRLVGQQSTSFSVDVQNISGKLLHTVHTSAKIGPKLNSGNQIWEESDWGEWHEWEVAHECGAVLRAPIEDVLISVAYILGPRQFCTQVSNIIAAALSCGNLREAEAGIFLLQAIAKEALGAILEGTWNEDAWWEALGPCVRGVITVAMDSLLSESSFVGEARKGYNLMSIASLHTLDGYAELAARNDPTSALDCVKCAVLQIQGDRTTQRLGMRILERIVNAVAGGGGKPWRSNELCQLVNMLCESSDMLFSKFQLGVLNDVGMSVQRNLTSMQSIDERIVGCLANVYTLLPPEYAKSSITRLQSMSCVLDSPISQCAQDDMALVFLIRFLYTFKIVLDAWASPDSTSSMPIHDLVAVILSKEQALQALIMGNSLDNFQKDSLLRESRRLCCECFTSMFRLCPLLVERTKPFLLESIALEQRVVDFYKLRTFSAIIDNTGSANLRALILETFNNLLHKVPFTSICTEGECSDSSQVMVAFSEVTTALACNDILNEPTPADHKLSLENLLKSMILPYSAWFAAEDQKCSLSALRTCRFLVEKYWSESASFQEPAYSLCSAIATSLHMRSDRMRIHKSIDLLVEVARKVGAVNASTWFNAEVKRITGREIHGLSETVQMALQNEDTVGRGSSYMPKNSLRKVVATFFCDEFSDSTR